jgi:hypothetical protein
MTGVNESDFIINLLPKEKIAFLKELEHVDAKLLLILKEELKQGNKILSVNDHVSGQALVVVLTNPFSRKYVIDGLQFESSNNPHDGGDSYLTPQPMPHTLTAPIKR